MASSQAILLLQKQLKDLCKNPVDGFSAGLVDESNVFEWNVTIMGPPETLYDGGFFNATITFPADYPVNPPAVRFTSEIWHPNVYPDGRVCISILHPPGDDPNGYELATERWNPLHTCDLTSLDPETQMSKAKCFAKGTTGRSMNAESGQREVFHLHSGITPGTKAEVT